MRVRQGRVRLRYFFPPCAGQETPSARWKSPPYPPARGRTRRSAVVRQTIRRRLQAKLSEVKAELRRPLASLRRAVERSRTSAARPRFTVDASRRRPCAAADRRSPGPRTSRAARPRWSARGAAACRRLAPPPISGPRPAAPSSRRPASTACPRPCSQTALTWSASTTTNQNSCRRCRVKTDRQSTRSPGRR